MRFKEVIAALEAAGQHHAVEIVRGLHVRRTRRQTRRAKTTNSVNLDIALKVHALHRATQLTQQEIAYALRINQGTVNHVLSGRVCPEALTLNGV